MSQLLKLSESWQEFEPFFITTTEVVRDTLQEEGKVYVVGESNHQQPLRVVRAFIKCVRVVLFEKPDVVISTGASVGCMVCVLSKMLGAKIIWVDSITNVEKISLSGRMVRYIADLFLVQWPKLTKKYKRVQFAGTLI